MRNVLVNGSGVASARKELMGMEIKNLHHFEKSINFVISDGVLGADNLRDSFLHCYLSFCFIISSELSISLCLIDYYTKMLSKVFKKGLIINSHSCQ